MYFGNKSCELMKLNQTVCSAKGKGTCGGKALNIFMTRTLHPLLSLVADDGHGEYFPGNKNNEFYEIPPNF